MLLTANMFTPTGGLIRPIWTTMTRMIPNHTGSKLSARAYGEGDVLVIRNEGRRGGPGVLEKYARLVGPAHLGAVMHAGPAGADVDSSAAAFVPASATTR